MPKILIVDDEPDIRSVLKMALRSLKHEIIEASNGKEALAKLKESKPDLILMDVMMPEMDGVSAIREIRKKTANTALPIIVLSAVGEKDRWVEALESGANDYVPKPFDPKELFARIRTHLKIATLSNQLAVKNHQLETERSLGSKIQQAILPRSFNFPDLSVRTLFQPSDRLSGDFFDVYAADKNVHFLIGDVSGHGTASALIMAATKGMFRLLAESHTCTHEILSEVNRQLCEILSENQFFVTLTLGVWHPAEEAISLFSAGHNPTLLSHGGKVEPIKPSGMALGFLPDQRWDVKKISFTNGDRLLLYTDGLTEIQSNGQQFGLSRTAEFFRGGKSPKEICTAAAQFGGGNFTDDVAILEITRTNKGAENETKM